MIRSIEDPEKFRSRRDSVWKRNVSYWLASPLRHVDDVGAYIANRVANLCRDSDHTPAQVIDMGFGNAWLLKALLDRETTFHYLGVDQMDAFVDYAASHYGHCSNAEFSRADIEISLDLGVQADIVVNAFNFFELCDLPAAMSNVSRHLCSGGRLLMSTIDKTYLILALSDDWRDFRNNLKLYSELPGIKYGFQKIDLGDRASDSLEYPSVLYSTQDFIDAARDANLSLTSYVEHPFTTKPIPKIYCHLEFQKDPG